VQRIYSRYRRMKTITSLAMIQKGNTHVVYHKYIYDEVMGSTNDNIHVPFYLTHVLYSIMLSLYCIYIYVCVFSSGANKKMKRAFCEPTNSSNNPPLTIARDVLLNLLGSFQVRTLFLFLFFLIYRVGDYML
jgi:hypothetical protein